MTIEPAFSIWFVAGAFGGLLNGFFVWATGRFGLNEAVGIAIKPEWNKGLVYNKVVWGGIWGLLFWLVEKSYSIDLLAAFLVSLAPTAVQLAYVFPSAGKGLGGKELGKMTWLFVIVANFVWAVGTCWWGLAGREGAL